MRIEIGDAREIFLKMQKSRVEENLKDMMTLVGHRVERDIFKKTKAQVFFLEGDNFLGKKECVLDWARTHFCIRPKAEGSPCYSCPECLRSIFFSNENVFWLVLQDRLSYFSFLLKRYLDVGLSKKDQSQKDQSQKDWGDDFEKSIEILRLQISRELMRVLHLHRSGVLPLVGEVKKSFSQGVSLSQQELEDLLSEVYQWVDDGWLSLGYQGEKIFPVEYLANVFQVFSMLQNSLDQSVITKKSLEKMFYFCQRQNANAPRFVFIDPVEKIHFSLVSSLLKILEEPPDNLFFFLGGSRIDTLNKEVLLPLFSRAVHLRFTKLKENDLIDVAQKKWFVESDRQDIFKLFSKTGRANFEYLWNRFRFPVHDENSDFEEENVYGKNFSDRDEVFPEHAKLITRGGFKNGKLQLGLLLSLFSSLKLSLSQLLAETRYAISMLLEGKMGKMAEGKVDAFFPTYLKKKGYRDCRILLRNISQLEIYLQRGTLSEKSVFLKWLLIIE